MAPLWDAVSHHRSDFIEDTSANSIMAYCKFFIVCAQRKSNRVRGLNMIFSLYHYVISNIEMKNYNLSAITTH